MTKLEPKKSNAAPVLWVGLLCVPLALGIYMAVMQGIRGPQQEPPAVPASVSGDGLSRGAASCDFSSWTGQKMTRVMGNSLKNRTYRILRPGESYTKDHRPGRVNIEVDQNGVITRVWCD